MIHTTVGVYNNDSFKVNGVSSEFLQDHIDYNIKYRFGRALFVDGKCVHEGYLSKDRCKEWENKLKSKYYLQTTDTAPYH